MFSSARQLFILEKGENMKLSTGRVENITSPVPKYTNNYQPLMQPEMVVDISVRVNDESMLLQKIDASQSVTNCTCGGKQYIVSDSRDAITQEVEAIRSNAQSVIDSVPLNEKIVSSCEGILKELNPYYAKEQYQNERMDAMQKQINGIYDKLNGIDDLKSMIQGLNISK